MEIKTNNNMPALPSTWSPSKLPQHKTSKSMSKASSVSGDTWLPKTDTDSSDGSLPSLEGSGGGMDTKRLLLLIVVMIGYLCVGAAIFNALEGPNEKNRKEILEREIDKFLGE